MARYISRVFIVIEADSEAEACDAMSATLSDNLKYGGVIVDWSYSTSGRPGARFDGPRELAQDSPADIGDLDDFEDMFANSRPRELNMGMG